MTPTRPDASRIEAGEHESELGRWRTARRAADPRLRAHVHGYFASSSELREPVRELHVPSPEVALVVNFGTPHRGIDGAGHASLRTSSGAEWTERDGSWVVGLHDRQQITQAVGERHFMVVRFTPMGAHRFLGVPMHAIANAATDLELIDPGLARVLTSRVARAGSWCDRFAAVEALIGSRIAQAEIPGAVDATWQTLVAADGRVALGSLAAELDCSHRTLIARFRTWVGFPPKAIARLLRFNRAVRTLDRLSRVRVGEPAGKPYIETERRVDRVIEPIRWADVAAECGYFDQAHLIKDFRAFAGSTPSAFLRSVSPAA